MCFPCPSHHLSPAQLLDKGKTTALSMSQQDIAYLKTFVLNMEDKLYEIKLGRKYASSPTLPPPTTTPTPQHPHPPPTELPR